MGLFTRHSPSCASAGTVARTEDNGTLKEWSKPWQSADTLGPERLGTLLEGLGSAGDGESRRDAVVALLAGGGEPCLAEGGAFAAAPIVTTALTDGFHNCLRERPVNAGQQPTKDRSSRKQC
jgi:hypothetical protein